MNEAFDYHVFIAPLARQNFGLLATAAIFSGGAQMSDEALTQALANFPATVTLKGQDYQIRLMSSDDGAALQAFAKSLPAMEGL